LATSELRPDSGTLIIRPARGWSALAFGELWKYRDLLLILALRDVRLRYKQTALGVIWVIMQPLVAALIFAIIFGQLAGLPSGETPYLLFVFAGLLPWNLFAGALQRAGNSLIGDARLITKIYFPRMVIPIGSSAAVVVDFLVTLAVMFVLIALFRAPLTLNLLALPLLTVLTLLVAIGISFIISSLNVYYRDFSYALPFAIQVWMYASPLVYTADIVPQAWRWLYALNPMVGVIEGFRWALLGVGEFPALPLLLSTIAAVALFVVGALIFQRVERTFADVI
jgi:lipopolysaccharide transport system permease protein